MTLYRELQRDDYASVLVLAQKIMTDMNQTFNVPMVASLEAIRHEFDEHLTEASHIFYGCFESGVMLGIAVFEMGEAYHENKTLSFVEKILHPDPTLPRFKQARVLIDLIRFIEKVAIGMKSPSYITIAAQDNTALAPYLQRCGYGDKEITLRKKVNHG